MIWTTLKACWASRMISGKLSPLKASNLKCWTLVTQENIMSRQFTALSSLSKSYQYIGWAAWWWQQITTTMPHNDNNTKPVMRTGPKRGVATHTCASLLITTEWSFNKSHELPILDANAWQTMSCATSAFYNSKLHPFFLLFCSMWPQRLYLAYTVGFNVFYLFE